MKIGNSLRCPASADAPCIHIHVFDHQLPEVSQPLNRRVPVEGSRFFYSVWPLGRLSHSDFEPAKEAFPTGVA
ncbi:hypothetical protein V1291_001532 [Nitrobacteraceae bacterium AZCC 1564]